MRYFTVIILFAKWKLQIQPSSFLITMVCNSAVIALFALTKRLVEPTMNIPISSWIVFVGKSVPSINYMVRAQWVAHTAPKIKYSALIWKRVITITPSRDSIPFPGFNQCDKSNTLRLLICPRSQISINRHVVPFFSLISKFLRVKCAPYKWYIIITDILTNLSET